MTKIKLFSLPNFATLANLGSGLFGILYCFKGNIPFACYAIFLAGLFDFFDGFIARLFKSDSELGKQLDSLCDVVSFGVLPGFIMYHVLVQYKEIALIIPLFSALRLAKFNIDIRQSDQFIGVPTPMNAFFMTGLAFIFSDKIIAAEINYLVIFLILISSLLLVAEFPLLSIKFKNLKFKTNIFRYLLIFSALLLVILLKLESFAIIYFVYLLLSVLNNFLNKNVVHS